jgi:aldose 1-epimerase
MPGRWPRSREAPPSCLAATEGSVSSMAEFEVLPFGDAGGQPVGSTVLRTRSGFEVEVLDYGAIVRRFVVPTKVGPRDVVLGLDDLGSYLGCSVFMGGIVGRVANRISHSRFFLNSREYRLRPSDPPHHLHGGKKGWDRVVWKSEASRDDQSSRVVLSYLSPDGDEGYPGNVLASVEYRLFESGAFRVTMRAMTDETTLVSMAQHNYWNLAGHDAGDVLSHELTLDVDEFTPSEDRIPIGTTAPVSGGALDFRTQRRIGEAMSELPGTPKGYDHNVVIRGMPFDLRPVAKVSEPKSGLTLHLSANQPGMQLYSGQFLDGKYQGKCAAYGQYAGLCLETQAFPNAVNVPAWRSQVLLHPGDIYEHVMDFRFEGCQAAEPARGAPSARF